MTTEIFLGEPPTNIKQWIIDNMTPTGHPETRFTLQGGTVETYNITGTIDRQWMVDNGYWNEGIWLKDITQVDIGNTVTSIREHVFEACFHLTSVTIPESVTSIGDWTFGGCNDLKSVTIPNSVTSIGEGAFSGCINLTSVTIPDSVTSIGDNAFYDCHKLTSVTFGTGVTSIGGDAFYCCTGLTSITIGDGVTSIGFMAFGNCSGLTSVTIVATGKPGASASNVKQAMITAGVSSSITWNMP